MDTLIGMRTFATVVKTGSFTAAADRLGMSKALASKYLNQLEQRLGVRLLNRTTRHLSLTEVGQVYYTRCQSLLEAVDELEAAIQDRHESPKGRLSITAPQTFGECYLAQAMARFLEQYPQVSVELNLTDRFVNLLEEGFDLGIRIGELADSSLVARRLASVRIITCAAPRYLERHGVPVHPLELDAHACVIDTNIDTPARWLYMIDGERRQIEVGDRFAPTARGRCASWSSQGSASGGARPMPSRMPCAMDGFACYSRTTRWSNTGCMWFTLTASTWRPRCVP